MIDKLSSRLERKGSIKMATPKGSIQLALYVALLTLSGNLVAAMSDIEWVHDLGASIGENSNVGLSAFKRDERESIFYNVNYSLIADIEIDGDKALTLKAFLESEQMESIDDLSRSTAGLQFIYRWQNTRGYLEPFYQFNTSIQVDEFDANQRDSTVSRTQLFATKRFSDSLTGVMGLEHFKQDSDSSAFDLLHNRLFFNMDYAITSKTLAYLAYSYRRGTIASSGQIIDCNGAPRTDIFPLIAKAEVIESDTAFNNAYCGTWSSYKLKADTQTLNFGVNFAVGNSSAIDLGVVGVRSDAERDISYENTVFRISYMVRL
jgi:hypothetical protein